MTEEQIAALDEYELLTHIRRIQQIANADRELNELLNERRRRQVVAAMGGETEDEREAREEVDRGRENVRHINQFARMLPREIKGLAGYMPPALEIPGPGLDAARTGTCAL